MHLNEEVLYEALVTLKISAQVLNRAFVLFVKFKI